MSPFPPAEVLGKTESFGLFPRTAPVLITGLTGGGVTNLDGIDVANMPVGTRISVVASGFAYNYTLTTSATAESAPWVVAPDSGNNAVRWILDSNNIVVGLFGPGAVGAPSISFFGDPDTGFYWPATGVITFTSNGVASLRFDANGTIGAGNGVGNSLTLSSTGAISLIAAGTNQNITLTPTGTGGVFFNVAGNPEVGIQSSGSGASIAGYASGHGSYAKLTINPSTDAVLFGTYTDSSNGKIQLATHTTSAGGIGFGTDTSIWRASTRWLQTTATQLTFAYGGNAYIDAAGASGVILLQTNGITALTLDTAQGATFVNKIVSTHATAGLGYATGAGGTVTQATSKVTAFTLSKICGQITFAADALAANTTTAGATWTNTAIAATDTVVWNHVSGGTLGAYDVIFTPGAGTCTVRLRNVTAGSLSEAPVIQFSIIKTVQA